LNDLLVAGEAEGATWSVQLLNAQREPLQVLATGQAEERTPIRAPWTGRDETGAWRPEGTYFIQLTGRDRRGRALPACEIRVVVDRQPPRVNIVSPQDGATVGSFFDVDVTVQEPHFQQLELEYRAGGDVAPWQPVPGAVGGRQTREDGTQTWRFRVQRANLKVETEGIFRLRAKAVDAAGQVGLATVELKSQEPQQVAVGFSPRTGERHPGAGSRQRLIEVWYQAGRGATILELRLYALRPAPNEREEVATYQPEKPETAGTFRTWRDWRQLFPAREGQLYAVVTDSGGRTADAVWTVH